MPKVIVTPKLNDGKNEAPPFTMSARNIDDLIDVLAGSEELDVLRKPGATLYIERPVGDPQED